MREIKFRAWDGEKMIYDVGIANNRAVDYDREDVWFWHEPEKEIMQYTGLKDKHGKEIYEGDILYGQTGYDLSKLSVEYHAPKWMLRHARKSERKGEASLVDINSGNACNFESFYRLELLGIIGNIHANPELLEETGK